MTLPPLCRSLEDEEEEEEEDKEKDEEEEEDRIARRANQWNLYDVSLFMQSVKKTNCYSAQLKIKC